MPHAIWKGDISFGLVYIPVALYSAESHKCEVKLHLLDKRDLSPIGYQKVNKKTGQKVPPDQIVEGYEYEEDNYIVLSKEEVRNLQPESTQSIEILEFVDGAEVQPEYFEKPYYLEPLKRGRKGYALLREILRKTKKIGIAKVVIRSRQYLAALLAEGDVILMELLRFPCELSQPDKFDIPHEEISKLGIQKKEIKIAEELVNSMTTKWDPSKYKNEHQGSLIDYVMQKIKLGESHEIKEIKEPAVEKKGEVIDLMTLLKKSIEKTKKPVKAGVERRGRVRKKTAASRRHSRG